MPDTELSPASVPYEHSTVIFESVVPGPEPLIGVKAIWAPVSVRAQCFGGRGNRTASPDLYYAIPRSVAERAQSRPFLVTIGGGAEVKPEFDGRVVELMRLSSVFGDTSLFVTNPELLQRLAQWPVAIAVHDVYDIEGLPLLTEDLGFDDRSILNAAFDNVVRPAGLVDQLWEKLRSRSVTLRNLDPIPNFRDPGKVVYVGTTLPRRVSAEEGRRLYREAFNLERKSGPAREAKRLNRERNSGVQVCEACRFSDASSDLFDAHHLSPLALGPRKTVPADLPFCALHATGSRTVRPQRCMNRCR